MSADPSPFEWDRIVDAPSPGPQHEVGADLAYSETVPSQDSQYEVGEYEVGAELAYSEAERYPGQEGPEEAIYPKAAPSPGPQCGETVGLVSVYSGLGYEEVTSAPPLILTVAEKREDVRVQAKIRDMGVCVAGFEWIKETWGYRCAGGNHFLGNDALGTRRR